MIDQTYNTYLNASTYISNTAFESASLSEEQLLAFADYTMAGLYHPLIMTDERTMMREAYRYELADEDAPLVLTQEDVDGFIVSVFSGSMPEDDEAVEASGEADEAA